MKVNIEYSNRHIHLSQDLAEKLFGSNYNLTSIKKLSQGEDFLSSEVLTIMGPKGRIENIKVLGPFREKTQVEILKSDTYKIGIDAPIKLSGDLKETPGVKIIGPLDEVDLEEGLIVAKRHLHISPEEAEKNKLKNGQKIKLEIKNDRSLVFDEIIVRVKDGFKATVHLDVDEANAGNIKQNDIGKIII